MSDTLLLLEDGRAATVTVESVPPRRARRRWTAVVIVAGITVVALAARLWQIESQSLWLDEAASVWYADQGLVALWSWRHPLDPFHPPGYYSLLALWTLGGHSELWVRSFSALAGSAAVPFVYSTARRLARRRAAGYLAALLLALAPLQVRFGQETRTYALMVLEASVMLWSLTWLLRYPRIASSPLRGNPAAPRWFAFVGAMGMTLLSHNTGPLMWLTANVAVLVHWRLTPHRPSAFLWAWARANLTIGAIWLVWFPVFVRQSLMTFEGGTHRKVPTGADLLAAFRDLSLGQSGVEARWRLLGDVLAVVALVAAILLARRRPLRRWTLTLAVFTLTAPALAVVASVVGKPVFLTQSLMWVSVPFFILVGVLAVQLPRPLALIAGAAAMAVTFAGLTAYYPSAHKEPWRDAAAYLRPRLEPGDLVVYTADYAMIPMQYYLHEPPGVTQIGTLYLPPDITTVRRELPDASGVWLVYAHEEFADPNRWVEKVLRERGDAVDRKNWSEDIEILRFLPRPPGSTGGP